MLKFNYTYDNRLNSYICTITAVDNIKIKYKYKNKYLEADSITLNNNIFSNLFEIWYLNLNN